MKEFKLIVAGGREFNDYARLDSVLSALASGELNDYAVSIVSGMARGADMLGVTFANRVGVHLYRMPADWDKWGKPAGFIRNAEMAKFADGLLAFWDRKSKGTQHMIETMQALNKLVWIVYY